MGRMVHLLLLNFASRHFEAEITWLVEVWKMVQIRGSFTNREEFFGFLKYEFKNDQLGPMLYLKPIPNFG